MEAWKELDWAQEVKSLAEAYGVKITELAQEGGYIYRSLLYKLNHGITSQERNALVKAIGRVNDLHARAMEG